MTKTRTVTADDAPHVIEASHEYTANFAISFVKIIGNEDDATPAGSGTLIKAAGRHAILTADHVLDNLPSTGEFGLVLPHTSTEPKIHRLRLSTENVRKVTVGKASYTSAGPDLGLLLLANRDAAALEATKAFYNLESRRERMLSDPPAFQDGGWMLVGLAAEWTSELPPERGFTRVKAFRGFCGAGVVSTEVNADAHDYLHFEAMYGNGYMGPVSFQGFSGGGLWQVRLHEDDGEVAVKEWLLSGVAFYESEITDGIRTIYCHGRRSVYDHAYGALMRSHGT